MAVLAGAYSTSAATKENIPGQLVWGEGHVIAVVRSEGRGTSRGRLKGLPPFFGEFED